MLDDAAAEAQLAEADELLTAVLFVPMGGKFFRFLVIVKVLPDFVYAPGKDGMIN